MQGAAPPSAAPALGSRAAGSSERANRGEQKMSAPVQGGWMGGGFELALGCDMIVATRSATFRFPEAGLGILTLRGGVMQLAEHSAVRRLWPGVWRMSPSLANGSYYARLRVLQKTGHPLAWLRRTRSFSSGGARPRRVWAVREVGPFLGSPAANHIRPTTFSAHLRKFRMSGLSESRRQQRAISMLSAASEKGLKTTPRGDPSSAQAGRIARPSPASTRLIAECTVSTRPTIGMLT